ncbi:hypothetical protein Tco_0692445 [Tanacetum coccineum]
MGRYRFFSSMLGLSRGDLLASLLRRGIKMIEGDRRRREKMTDENTQGNLLQLGGRTGRMILGNSKRVNRKMVGGVLYGGSDKKFVVWRWWDVVYGLESDRRRTDEVYGASFCCGDVEMLCVRGVGEGETNGVGGISLYGLLGGGDVGWMYKVVGGTRGIGVVWELVGGVGPAVCVEKGACSNWMCSPRFEALYDAHLALKERCEDVTRQLVSTRTNFTHVSNLYNALSNRYQQVRGEHAGCKKNLINAERERDELRAVNADQASHIKELEAELARKDSALVFSDRISNERAVENEKLVSKLGYFEKEKTDSIGKLLPTVVRRLLNSHEYKESLSIPFNLAIQAGWAKGLAVKRSEKDLMDVLREVQGFDPHSDTRMTVEYDKLFTKTYPFVEKISGLPRRPVQELLKMYPAPPPQDAPAKVNPSSQAPDGSKSVPTRD